jgi:chromatin remodeling complex protein RSC6
MNNKIQPLEIHTTTNIDKHASEKEYTLDEETNCNQSQQWGRNP